jgi:hypothetical protein
MTDPDGPKTYGSYRSGSTTLQIILGKYCSGPKMQFFINYNNITKCTYYIKKELLTKIELQRTKLTCAIQVANVL